MCPDCGDGVDVEIAKGGSLGALETISLLHLHCPQCGYDGRSHRICDQMIVKLAQLTRRSLPNAEQSETELMVKVDELKDLIRWLCPVVARNSFTLGILYRELADVYERLGRMDNCVEAYKMLIPVVEYVPP